MGLMQITIREETVGLLEYGDPIIGTMKRAGIFQKNMYRMTPVNVNPSKEFISEDLERWIDKKPKNTKV